MAQDTLRDSVWREVIKRRDDGVRIVKPDIQRQTDASDRTVHDVLQTCVDYGLLQKSTTIETRNDPRTADGTQQQEVAVFDRAEDITETDDRAETGSQNIEGVESGDETPTPGDESTETIAIPEADIDEHGRVDVDWPIEGSADNYRANFDGIGPQKAKRLANRFGSFEEIIKAPVDDITIVKGIGRATAKDMKYWLMQATFGTGNLELTVDDVPDTELDAFADMFTVPEDIAESFQATAVLARAESN